MEKNDGSGSPGWGASFILQTTEEIARAVYSSKEDSGGHLQKLQDQFFRVLKGLSQTTEEKSSYNPEVLTSQKRQWASFHLQALHRRILKEPSRLFESMVVVGLHPNSDIQLGSGRLQNATNGQHQSTLAVANLEPQVLFVYPPDKQLPLKYRDLLSFCFPSGVEVNAVERTPSMSELNEILLGQEHLKQSDLSFIFRLQGADDSILYGCCLVADELVQKPSRLISMMSDGGPARLVSSRRILTTRRCYCILSRLPFFYLHFGVLNSISTEERLERLRQSVIGLDLESPVVCANEEYLDNNTCGNSAESGAQGMPNGTTETVQLSRHDSINDTATDDQSRMVDHATITDSSRQESLAAEPIPKFVEGPACDIVDNNQPTQRHIPNAILPLLRYQNCDSSESSSSLQGSPSDDRNIRSELDLAEMDEASFSSQEDNELDEILDWAKANSHGSLQIICEYYRLHIPERGSTIRFHPLEHLHPLEFHRPEETVLHAGSDLVSHNTNLEIAEAYSALAVEEEATAMSVWAIACLCGSLRLEHVLTIFAGALLEKQIVFLCSNLGILSASVLSIIPLIRPYHWQSFLMPVLPNDMLDFLDAPVPFIVGVKHKTAEVQSKTANVIFVDANKNQVKSSSLPHLPRQRELYTALSPYHSQLVGESYLGKRRQVYDCSEVQVEAAKGFLQETRSYLDSLCSNLRSHTITNVQSNDDKVSLLLKESFIDSFPSRDRPFMKQLFVETQLFSVHTDLVLSYFQKD
ncbi:putative cDENN domain, uDENN domain, tripartite DENN domain, DENN domain lobe protein [Helianthus annuus]|uniref:CDENN domain, uDENN domain, tripartite DENN domain-containing protein n=1 Tax=Helianthus annuus TaxID=4232 RepID=A0A9K3ITI2_HELAN|nr:putative cDENN domain, uDENN domain, tripartite DENN domain-containing protein [Helianthus annuus]KAJ0573638.1 putative cDENN domain, uDENN domain, tripartite DENN domain, DENN domain lobe protein [Helianthus annuus]KAJ0737995.1 putative cDENN domain, uDENN domain, tripartite DENN domain, DENN domain lobe protein [Helianthus annuus]KAJ0911969.1 putative cDENN domain, uDENN domain, tripartite DENN domain, DENN domain lobe protein [Helianthus annuus]